MVEDKIQCRKGCGACCIYISISSPIPNHPNGKPAGVICKNLDGFTHECTIWKSPEFPDICRRFNAVSWLCGESFQDAKERIQEVEKLTS